MDLELEKKINSIIKLKTFLNHSMNLSNAKLRKIITDSVRKDNEIDKEDKQKTIEHFFSLLKDDIQQRQ